MCVGVIVNPGNVVVSDNDGVDIVPAADDFRITGMVKESEGLEMRARVRLANRAGHVQQARTVGRSRA